MNTDQIAQLVMLVSVLVMGYFVYKLWKDKKFFVFECLLCLVLFEGV